MNFVETNPDFDVNRVQPGTHGLFTVEELRDATHVADKLILAVRNISLYPTNHAVAQKAIQETFERLNIFIERHGTFVVGIDQSALNYKGRELPQKKTFHKDLAYACYRDGIQHIVFSRNISFDTIEKFIRIVSRRSLMEDDTEGDIVTDLWEARLAGIQYEVNDHLWENETLLDISSLKTRAKPSGRHGVLTGTAIVVDDSCTDAVETHDRSFWKLSSEELEATRKMVYEENHRTFDQDVFDVFLLILEEQREKEDFSNVLDIIIECFKRTLARCEFAPAARFLLKIRRVYEKYRADNYWALPLLDDFLMMISSRRVLQPLAGCLKSRDHLDAVMLKDMESMLRRLSPECVLFLGILQPEVSLPIRKHLNRAIMHLAAIDHRPLYQLAKHSSASVARQAIINLSRLGKTDHIPVILEAAANSDIRLKRVAVKALTKINPPPYKKILPFILVDDEIIRQTIYNFLVQKRDADMENMLIDYINQETFFPHHQPSVILLYRSLGNIGSVTAFEFLKDRLFGKPWWPGEKRFLHRQGAAAGLRQHEGPEALKQLKIAADNFWPSVRKALDSR
jgi:hypothetical protein